MADYWYEFDEYECIMCGGVRRYGSRVYDRPRPVEYSERHHRHDEMCTGCQIATFL